MKTSKIIFHIDMNCFYAACEIAANPKLAGKPVVVAHEDPLRRSIILTANYEARAYGIKTTMSVRDAIIRCNHVIVVEPNMERYSDYSKKFFSYLESITPFLEKASIDEGYLDVTTVSEKIHPLELASTIQKHLNSVYGLPCSIGIGPNKFLAKMASDFKKPMGITVFRKREIDQFLWPLPIEKMFGVGKKTAPKLRELGIHTIGDLANIKNRQLILQYFGDQYAQSLIDKANGIDDSDVIWQDSTDVLSVSNSHTFDKDYTDEVYIKNGLKVLTNSVSHRLKEKKLKAQTIGIQLRFSNFKTINRSKSMNPTHNEKEMLNTIYELYDEWVEPNTMIRLIGVFATRLVEEKQESIQYTIFDDLSEVEKKHQMQKLLEEIKHQYGSSSIEQGYYSYDESKKSKEDL